jgi:hypothetical protein
LVAILTTVGLVVAAVPANAAPSRPHGRTFQPIPVSGTTTPQAGGAAQTVNGTFTPMHAAGTRSGPVLVGRLVLPTSNGTVNQIVSMPVSGSVVPPASASPSATAAAPSAVTPALVPPGPCKVLHLELGPLSLNVLGLIINLNRVVLDITADPNGGLLGSLLCSLSGGPTGGALGGLLQQLVGILNQILGQLGLGAVA